MINTVIVYPPYPGLRRARDLYEIFEGLYDLAERACKRHKGLSKETRDMLKSYSEDLLAVPWGLRMDIAGLDEKLEKMIEMGFLRPKRSQISSVDPATSKLYFDNAARSMAHTIAAHIKTG